jgi:hypothetical protein
MRSYLHYQGCAAFTCKMLSDKEIESLKNFKQTPIGESIFENKTMIKSDDELWFLMHANMDKKNTIAFYRLLIEKTLDDNLGKLNIICGRQTKKPLLMK